MQNSEQALSEQALIEFVKRHQGVNILSTGSKVVYYEGVLYNVEGSTDDPKITSGGWKSLLLKNGIDGDCYVTHPLPEPNKESTHNQFNVGGHMTPNADGSVISGGICYLMPLCHWHNSTARDRYPFEHDETKMLELSGYMEGDSLVTFLARSPEGPDYQLISIESNSVIAGANTPDELPIHPNYRKSGDVSLKLPEAYFVFHRFKEGGAVRFEISDARLP